MILVQWRAVGTVGHSGGGSTEGPIKSLRHITVGHLLSTVADELWEILARTHTHICIHTHRLCPAGFTHGGGARHTLMYERFGLEGGVADVCDEVMLRRLLFHPLYP